MLRKIKKGIIFGIGFAFLAFGIAGLFLPFLQGIIFIAIGIILLSLCSPKIGIWANNHTKRYPKLASVIEKGHKKIAKFIGEI